MPTLAEQLKNLYDTANGSEKETEYYAHIYEYLDLVVQTPELSTLMSDEAKKLTARFEEIQHDPYLSEWGQEQLADRTRVESVYPKYMYLYMNLYLTVQDHLRGVRQKNPEIWAVLQGEENVPPEERKFMGGVFRYWRENFKNTFDQLHPQLLTVLQNKKAVEKTPTPAVVFDEERSILTIGDKRVRLTLKNDKTNAHYVLQYIFEHGKENPADFTDILKEQFPLEGMDWRAVYRACKDIENKVREQAGITDFLTTTTGKTGWVKINPLYA